MRIILSPAKKMKEDADNLDCLDLPVFLDKTGVLAERLKSSSYADLKTIWKCNDNIVEQNIERLANMNLYQRGTLTPAILAYEGLAFQYMAPTVFDEKDRFITISFVENVNGKLVTKGTYAKWFIGYCNEYDTDTEVQMKKQ